MKFTKEDAYKELASKIPSKGQTLNLSERSINEQLEALMPLIANEETELADFVDKVLPIFKTADGNVRNDVSAGIKTYQEQNPLPKPQPTQEPPKIEDPNEALLKRIEELEKRNADNEKKSTLSKRRSDIVTKMAEKGCKDEKWINDLLDEVNLDGDDFDVDGRVDKYVKMYNKNEAKTPQNITPKKPTGGSDDSYLKEVLKAVVEKNKTVDGAGQ